MNNTPERIVTKHDFQDWMDGPQYGSPNSVDAQNASISGVGGEVYARNPRPFEPQENNKPSQLLLGQEAVLQLAKSGSVSGSYLNVFLTDEQWMIIHPNGTLISTKSAKAALGEQFFNKMFDEVVCAVQSRAGQSPDELQEEWEKAMYDSAMSEPKLRAEQVTESFRTLLRS